MTVVIDPTTNAVVLTFYIEKVIIFFLLDIMFRLAL